MINDPDSRPGTPLEITVAVSDTEVRLLATGSMDLSNADDLLRCADSYLSTVQRVVADLADLTFIDSSGLRALALSRRHALQLGKTFAVENAQRPVAEVIDLAGLTRYLTDPSYTPD